MKYSIIMKLDEGVWVIVPAYNELKTIAKVVKELKEYTNNLVVVDDGSRDNTFEVVKELGVFVLRHIVNLGKGAALKTGCEFALRKGAKILVFIDADCQHKPEDIPKFVDELRKENADIVFGYRKLTKDMPAVFKFGNWLINFITKFIYGVNLNDTQSGFRCLRAETYRKIKWDSQDYSVESEMVAKVGKRKLRYRQIPIQTIYSDKYKGTTVLDGIKFVLKLIWWSLFR